MTSDAGRNRGQRFAELDLEILAEDRAARARLRIKTQQERSARLAAAVSPAEDLAAKVLWNEKERDRRGHAVTQLSDFTGQLKPVRAARRRAPPKDEFSKMSLHLCDSVKRFLSGGTA